MRVPAGSIVLHIGPHKTGTTAVQAAFHAARAAVRAQGVHYPGPNSQPMFAIYAVTAMAPAEIPKVPLRRWMDLVRDIQRARAPRTLVSSEGLCDADEQAIARIVGDLGADRTHVVITARPLVDLLPSQWQQSVQEGLAWGYDRWLDVVLNHPEDPMARRFWHRQRHDALVERWRHAVGPDRVRVVISSNAPRERLLWTFEELLGLDPGTLPTTARSNRSLTADEVDLVRAVHARMRSGAVAQRVAVRLVRDGVAELLRRRVAAPDERRIVTPAWARARAREIGEDIVRALERLEPTVHGGTLADLLVADRDPIGDARGDGGREPRPELASSGPAGVLLVAGRARGRSGSVRAPLAAIGAEAWGPTIAELRSESLATLSQRQIARGLTARWRRSVRRVARGVVPGQLRRRSVRRAAATGPGASPPSAETLPAWAEAGAITTFDVLRSVTTSPDAARPSDFETADLAVLGSGELVSLLVRRLAQRGADRIRTAWPSAHRGR